MHIQRRIEPVSASDPYRVCCVCGTDYVSFGTDGQAFTGANNEKRVGDVCSDCLRLGPRHAESLMRMRSISLNRQAQHVSMQAGQEANRKSAPNVADAATASSPMPTASTLASTATPERIGRLTAEAVALRFYVWQGVTED